MKIGIVDIDTSHPDAWIPIEREMGHEVVALWDGGSVHPPKLVAEFAAKHGISRICRSLDEMTGLVDAVVIHAVDWDTHVVKARPFVDAGKAVLIDKPLAGNLSDLRMIERWAGAGRRITGGSSLRFADEVMAFHRQRDPADLPQTVFCGCAVDEFNYGIHAYALLTAAMGSDVAPVSVRHLGQAGQRRILVRYPEGRTGIVVIGAAAKWLPYYVTVVTQATAWTAVLDHNRLYRALLAQALPYLAGERAEAPTPVGRLLEPELLALAAQLSWTEGDREVRVDDPALDGVWYDGNTFAAQYRAARYPQAC